MLSSTLGIASLNSMTSTFHPSTPQNLRAPAIHSIAETILTTPDSRARHYISQCIRDALSGIRPLQNIHVSQWRRVSGAIFYDIVVEAPNNIRWSLSRRYQEFYDLNKGMEMMVRNYDGLPPFPDKQWKVLTDHYSEEFLCTRQVLFNNYLKKLLASKKLQSSALFLEFLRPNHHDMLSNVHQFNKHSPQAADNEHSHNGISPSLPSTAESLFEPRSLEQEWQHERAHRIRALSGEKSELDAEDEHAHNEEQAVEVESDPEDHPRRLSHSQLYDKASHASSSTSHTSPNSVSSISPAKSSSFTGSAYPAPVYVSPEVSDVCIPSAQILKVIITIVG